MPKYTINTQHNGHYWVATFDGYDGAPDATGPDSLMGTGDTETDAVVDLLTQELEGPQGWSRERVIIRGATRFWRKR